MEIRPIASALTRNKTGLVLIALQVALTLAIVCNSLFIIFQRLERMGRPSGLDEANLFTFRTVPFKAETDMQPQLAVDLAALRALPGVVDAVSTNSLPLSGGGWSTGVSKKPPDPSGRGRADASTAVFLTDDHGIEAFGLRLVAGRDFAPDELRPLVPNGDFEPTVLILSQALATKLYPDGDALGKSVYAFGQKPATVIGIVERLQSAWPRWDDTEQALLAPGLVAPPYNNIVVRTRPGERDAVMQGIEARMRAVDDQRILDELRDFGQVRQESYRRDRAMTVLLVSVIVALLVITGLGIVGMASFWVTSRTKQIGTRRALGARKRDVTRYFQTENALITLAGLALGAVLAYALNLWLMQAYELPRLAWYYVPAGAVALLALGQAAVLGPARRGAAVPPAVATRSV